MTIWNDLRANKASFDAQVVAQTRHRENLARGAHLNACSAR
jgi:hypothetical protein